MSKNRRYYNELKLSKELDKELLGNMWNRP